jgi:hypothetical protein
MTTERELFYHVQIVSYYYYILGYAFKLCKQWFVATKRKEGSKMMLSQKE